MLEFQGKPLEILTLHETYEYEKQLLERLSQASRAQMSNLILGQINMYIQMVREHKVEILERERLGLDSPDYAQKQKALNIGDEQEQSDNTE